MKTTILETERLIVRELDAKTDAAFVNELLNSPGFLEFIGDRGVRSDEAAAEFIDTRYRKSYTDHGYGLYAVVLKETGETLGLNGFVRRDGLDHADLGFAFLPGFEGKGYAYESGKALMDARREKFSIDTVLAITTQHNTRSQKLLGKLGFEFVRDVILPQGDEVLKLFSTKAS